MSTLPVKWFSSLMRGSPAVSGTAGSLINLLDAYLVDGFGHTNSNSANINNNILTINISNSETFEKYSVVSIEGDTEINGEHRVIEKDTTYIKIAFTGANRTITSNLTIKYASLGWSKVQTVAPSLSRIYIPKESHSGFNFYVNDDFTCAAHVKLCKGYKDNSDFNKLFETLIDPMPITPAADRTVWVKSYISNATTKFSFLIGDGSLFYYQWGRTDTTNIEAWSRQGRVVPLGDINRYSEDDKGAAVMFNNQNALALLSNYGNNFGQTHMARRVNLANNPSTATVVYSSFLTAIDGETKNNLAGVYFDGLFIGDWSGQKQTALNPMSKGGGFELLKILATTERTIRGEYPGIFYVPFPGYGSDDFTFVEGCGNMTGKIILLKSSSCGNGIYEASTDDGSVLAYDIVGPWR